VKDLYLRGWNGKKMLYKGDLTKCETMLATGITDRKGTMIFEGDLVHVTAGLKGTYPVIFLEGAFCLGPKGKLKEAISFIKIRDEYRAGIITGRKQTTHYSAILEVVGNMFEGQTGRKAPPDATGPVAFVELPDRHERAPSGGAL